MLAVIVTFFYHKRSLISLLLILLDFFPRRSFPCGREPRSSIWTIVPAGNNIYHHLSAKKKQVLICNYAKLEGRAGSCLTICHITGLSINYQRSIGNNPRQKQNFWLILQSSVFSLQSLISLSDFLLSLSATF